jgi:hypothetical protein
MELDTTLVMKEFISGMSSLFVMMGFGAIIALCLAGTFVYLVHHRGDGYYGE